ncbi:MAG: DNA repair and recombination protein RadB [archaeon]
MLLNESQLPVVMDRISTGSSAFDWLLDGGYERDAITTIYGPAGSGKTNLCILAMVQMARNFPEKKVIYIDTEGSFSVERLKQIAPDVEAVLKCVAFLNPTTFEEQKKVFLRLNELVTDKVSLIIFDSVALLYRLEIGRASDVYNVNRELGIQIGILSQIARKVNIPVLITNQIYADFEDKNRTNMVGGDLLKYQSKCLIELQKFKDRVVRKAILRKHRSLPENREIQFYIVNEGICDVKSE